jgi:hypothetical protein
VSPLRPRGLFLAALLLAAPSFAQELRRAPSSLAVVADEGDEGEEDDAPPPPTRRPDGTTTKPRPLGPREEPTRPWTQQPERRGLQVIEENTGVSVDVKPELPQDRAGRPLGSGRGGTGLGIRPEEETGSFTFRANEEVPARLDEREVRRAPPAPAPARPAPARAAPSGLLLPSSDEDFEETAPAPLPSQRTLYDSGSRVGVTPPGEFTGRPVDRGTGASIRVEEVKVEPVQNETTIRAPPRLEKPAVRPPDPVVSRPAPAAAPPDPGPSAAPALTPKRPDPPAQAVPAMAETPARAAAPTSPDPFEKLERDLEAVDGPRAKAPEPPRPAREPAVTAPEPAPAGSGALGLILGLGGGVLLAADSSGVLAPRFAYGAQVAWSPAALPELALDLSAFRSGSREGPAAATVDASTNHFGLRALYQKSLAGPLSAHVGLGALLTLNTAAYTVAEKGPVETTATFARPGADLTMGLGLRLRPLDVRFDARVLLRGGLRLEVLPTVSVGVAL